MRMHGNRDRQLTLAPRVRRLVSWPTVEPADDYTANSLLAFALAAG